MKNKGVKMKLRLITALLILTAFGHAAVKNMVVSLWPEYDHPGVLVILSGDFSEDTPLPIDLSFQIPDGVKQALTLGVANAGDSTIAFPIVNNALTVSFKHRHFQLEYYVHPFIDDHTREMKYTLQPGFEVLESLTFYVQEPLIAQQFKLSFEADAVESDRHGLKYHRKDFGATAADFTYTASFSYHNHEELLSIEKLRQMMAGQAQAGGENAPTQAPSPSPANVWIYIILGILVVIVLAVFNRKTVAGYAEKGKPSADKAFCTECGRAINDHYNYCPWCGVKRK
jgi:hypothetical protein